MFFRSCSVGKSTLVTICALIMLLLLLACASVTFQMPSAVASNKNGAYYAQLDETAQNFYDALYDMYSKGYLKTGTAEYDLIDKNVVTNEQARAYANGDKSILRSFAVAKDAFLMDYNVFYVDFSKLQLSVGIKENKYVVTMGAGRNSNFYANDFTSEQEVETALTAYKLALNEIVKTAQAGNSTQEKIKLANKAILEKVNFGYGVENGTINTKDAMNITTSYGALCNGTAIYEGYARAFRDILTQLEIENVLINGYILNENESFTPAMWNYVKIDNAWYAIDAGLNKQSANSDEEFLLVGQWIMESRHYTSGIISSSSREFTYPKLSEHYYGYEEALYVEVLTDNGVTSANVSFNEKNATKLAESDIYLAFRLSESAFDTQEIEWGNWLALSVLKDSAEYQITETDTATTMVIPNEKTYFQFAVIEGGVKPNETTGEFDSSAIKGELLHIAELENTNHKDYRPAPIIKEITPAESVLDADKTYTIKFGFNQELEKIDANEPVTIKVTKMDEQEIGTVSNINWVGNTITFSFKPSSLFNDSYQYYTFEVCNLRGLSNKKTPIPWAYSFQKYNVNLSNGGQNRESSNGLALNEYNDFDLSGWTFEQGGTTQTASNLWKNQLNFVSSTLNSDDTDTIVNRILNDKSITASDILLKKGYEIGLNLCGEKVTSINGDTLKISTKIATKNTSYRAYVCEKNESGVLNLDKISEAKCFLNGDELVIETDKFGALVLFAVNPSSVSSSERVLLIKNINGNGSISAKVGGVVQTDTLSLKLNENVIIEFSPDLDYKIATCLLNGKALDVVDNKVIISYNDLNATNMVDVCFVASRVMNNETTYGITNLQNEFLAHQIIENGINWGLWVSVGVCATAVVALLVVWLILVIRNKKREKLARELNV